MREGRIIFVSHHGPLTVKTWRDDSTKTPSFVYVAGECSECHQFPCEHSNEWKSVDETANKVLP